MANTSSVHAENIDIYYHEGEVVNGVKRGHATFTFSYVKNVLVQHSDYANVHQVTVEFDIPEKVKQDEA